MQKKRLEKYKNIMKYIPVFTWRYIFIIGFLTIGLFGWDFYKWHNNHKYFLFTSIKQAMIIATTHYHTPSQLENKASYPLTAKNNAVNPYFSEKQQGGSLNKSPFIQMTDASSAANNNNNTSNSLTNNNNTSNSSTNNNNASNSSTNNNNASSEELSNHLANKPPKIPVSTADEFPPNLPHSVNNEQEPTEHFSTPEYVIIRSSDQATFSSETTAHVALLTVEEGSYFKIGDILLELDCREQQAELKKAQAQQQAAREAEKSATKLQGYGSISETELIKAESDAAMANADVERLTAVVDKCTIKAPFNGAVAELMVHAHETVKPGDPLLKIVNTENLEVQMQVPSNWLRWIHIGTPFNVHVSEINQSIVGVVTKINPQIDSVSQTVKIVGAITTHNPNLLPGMSGQALFPDNPDLKNIKSKN